MLLCYSFCLNMLIFDLHSFCLYIVVFYLHFVWGRVKSVIKISWLLFHQYGTNVLHIIHQNGLYTGKVCSQLLTLNPTSCLQIGCIIYLTGPIYSNLNLKHLPKIVVIAISILFHMLSIAETLETHKYFLHPIIMNLVLVL